MYSLAELILSFYGLGDSIKSFCGLQVPGITCDYLNLLIWPLKWTANPFMWRD